jgi:hypothetical protein
MSDWQKELAPTPDCIALENLGNPRTDAELEHVKTCVRCQTELALFGEFNSDDASVDETRESRWIADELHRRLDIRSNVKQFQPRRRTWAALAAAAVAVFVIGTGYWMETREPALDPTLGTENVYRTARLEAQSPIGDLAQAPNELQWTAVPNATAYSVRILEIDRTLLWSTDTPQRRVTIPTEVVAQFAPGKTVLWEVTARRHSDVLASSGTQSFRVTVPLPRRTR